MLLAFSSLRYASWISSESIGSFLICFAGSPCGGCTSCCFWSGCKSCLVIPCLNAPLQVADSFLQLYNVLLHLVHLASRWKVEHLEVLFHYALYSSRYIQLAAEQLAVYFRKFGRCKEASEGIFKSLCGDTPVILKIFFCCQPPWSLLHRFLHC